MKTTLLLLLTFILFSVNVFGQPTSAVDKYNTGKKAYDDDSYPAAIEAFKDAIRIHPSYEDAYYYLGASYYYYDQYDLAIETFQKLENMNPNYWAWFYYWWGNSYFYQNLDIGKMQEKFEQFHKKFPEKPKYQQYHHEAMYKIRYARESVEIRKMPKTMDEPSNMGSVVNSEFEDYQPQSNPTGKILYFTSTRKGSPYNLSSFSTTSEWGEDIYEIEKTENGWSSPRVLPSPINSTNNDGSATFSGDGQTMVYGACNREEGIGSCDLYIATLQGNSWSTPINMGNVVNSDKWEAQPALSADGSMLLFCSERVGGYGNSDIYMSLRNPFGEWGVSQNLGPIINTPSTESSPFLSADGKTLYFASYGHPGHGGSDLFVSTFENGKWTEPRNMGSPLNSSENESNFTIGGTGEVGFFASERKGGMGLYDLYTINIPENMRPTPTVIVSGIVSDIKTNSPIESWVLVEDINTSELIATGKSNSATGKYLVVLPSGRNYSVSANKEGYLFYSKKFDVPVGTKYSEITQNISLSPIEKGAKVVLNNIFFETGKAILDDESQLELNKVIQLMKANPSMKIELGGHTDNVGEDAANLKLSQDRAKKVMEFLINGGITQARLTAKGYGETAPMADNTTPEGRKANRRTEFIILEI